MYMKLLQTDVHLTDYIPDIKLNKIKIYLMRSIVQCVHFMSYHYTACTMKQKLMKLS